MSDPSASPPESSGPERGNEGLSGSHAMRDAAALAGAVALVASLPSALRTSAAGGFGPGALAVGVAVLGPLAFSLLALGRGAGRGLRMLTGRESGAVVASFVALWIGLASPVLLVLASVLKSGTNHRGLGGTTFGVVALGVLVGAALVAWRVGRSSRALVERGVSERIVALVTAAVAVVPTLLMGMPVLLRASSKQEAEPLARHVLATLLDGLLLGAATAVAGSIDRAAWLRGARARAASIAAVAVFVAGLAGLGLSPTLAVAMRRGGGLAATVLGALERFTDHDRDGHGAHFGGSDCDEGDPSRHPGAVDPAGDGRDQDCDGADGPVSVALAPTPSIEGANAPAPIDEAAPSKPSPSAAERAAPKTIVVVAIDSLRADHTTPYGYDRATTPHLARFAERATRFEHAYASASDTQRALLPLFSGRRLASTPREGRGWPRVADAAELLAERLTAKGYATAAVSSFTWISKEKGFSQGFERFVEVFREAHPERATTGPLAVRAARVELERASDDPRPLFLWVHLFDAHERHLPRDGFDFGRGPVAAYDGEVGFVDAQLGELLAAIEASPRGRDAAVLVHGTQGEALGEHGERGHGRALFDEEVRVPLLVALPGARAGATVPTHVSTLDVVPTVLELAGIASPELEGSSLLPLLSGASSERAPLVLRGAKAGAVIDGPLKLVVEPRRGSDRVRLFDRASDPREARDVSEARPDDVARLRAVFDAFETANGGEPATAREARR